MRKYLVSVGFAPAALAATLAMADDLSFFSPYEILTDHLGCAEPGMVTLHVKFDTQASATYFVNGLNIDHERDERCEIATRKGTARGTAEVPCPEGVAPMPPTEEELSAVDRVSKLPKVVDVEGELFHCLMSGPRDASREAQMTLSGTWSAELPKFTAFTISEGEFGRWKSRAMFYPSRTELLFDGYTEITLPPYLRLFLEASEMQDANNDVYGAKIRLITDLQLVPRLDGTCDLGGETC
jgi:hypothetical protein